MAVNLIQPLWFNKRSKQFRVTGELFTFLPTNNAPRRDFWPGNLRGIGGAAAGGCECNGGESRNPAKPVTKLVKAS